MKKNFNNELEKKIELKKELKKFIKKNKPVNLILKKVSANGMSRNFTILGIKNGTIIDLTNLVARLLGYNSKYDGISDYIILKGCGMDMAWSLAYNIKNALYDKKAIIANKGEYRLF